MSEIDLPSRISWTPPSFDDEKDKRSGPDRRCLMKDLMYYWSIGRPECFNPKAPTNLAMSYFPLRIVAAEWVYFVVAFPVILIVFSLPARPPTKEILLLVEQTESKEIGGILLNRSNL